MPEYNVITGAMWTQHDVKQGPIPLIWSPEDLPEKVLFTISIRTLAVYSASIRNMQKVTLLSAIPFPEFDIYSFSDVLILKEEDPKEDQVQLISIFIPIRLMKSPWSDLPQIQRIFQKHLSEYWTDPQPNRRKIVLKYIAKDVDKFLHRIQECKRLRNHLENYLNSFFYASLDYNEALLLQTRIETILQLLDRVLKSGDYEKTDRSLARLTYLLEQELQDELVFKYLSIPNTL